jgi:hypothetical protein
MASAFGASLVAIAKVLSAGGMKVSKASIGRWYLAERRALAIGWKMEKHQVDASTRRRWRELFERRSR